ncbi:MAG: YciC family protein [Pseudomonadota bacterium]|jgi:hypothetical protein|nr:YciC family protein [Pseudomonadota bacterium]
MTSDYLRHSLFFFRTHLGRLALIQLPFLLLITLVQYPIMHAGDAAEVTDAARTASVFLSSALDLALMPIYWGATLLYMHSVLQGNPLSTSRAISLSLSCWGRLLLTYLLTTLAVSGGLLLLLLPGIYIGVRLAFAEFYCVMEGKGPMQSLRASWASSAEFFWPLLQGLALIFSLLMLANVLIGRLSDEVELLRLALLLLVQFLGVLPTIYAYRIYCVMQEERQPL